MKHWQLSLLVAISMGTAGSQVRAGFSYDFEGLTAGQALTGQDGWTSLNDGAVSALVATGTGTDTTKILTSGGNSSIPLSDAFRSLPAGFGYTSADTTVEFSVDIQRGNPDTSVFAGLSFGDPNSNFNRTYIGFQPAAGGAQELVLFAGDAVHTGAQFMSVGDATWYHLTELIDFSVPGGQATVLLNGQSGAGIGSWPLDLTPSASGAYTATDLTVSIADAVPAGGIDNLALTAPGASSVPLPSAAKCGLLCGGLALLAARRFRGALNQS